MLTMRQEIVLLLFVFLSLWMRTTCTDEALDYDYGDDEDMEDCHVEIDIKTFKKTPKLVLCDSLQNPSLTSRIQLQIFSNHTEDKVRLRALSLSPSPNANKSLIALTTDIIDDFTHPTSLLTIDDYQLIGPSNVAKLIQSLIKSNLSLLSRNLKKTLILPKGDEKSFFSCNGNYYPNQDTKLLNISSDFPKAITCTREPQTDRFFTLQEKVYLLPSNKNTFRLAEIHQDDPKKISRSTWYICNNPTVCAKGIQKKVMLDKTVTYAIKFLQKVHAEKKAASG